MEVSEIADHLRDVKVLSPRVFGDERGFFLEVWSKSSLGEAGIPFDFIQENWSRSSRGVLRGLHYQMEHPQGKLVRVTRGAIFDVAVDMRKSSDTYGNWAGTTLGEENKKLLWVPPGFAHGFLALTDDVDLHYLCTDVYHPESERSVRWDDPDLGIEWPLDDGQIPELSEKDLVASRGFADADCYP